MGGEYQIAPLSGPMDQDSSDRAVRTQEGFVRERRNLMPTLPGSVARNTGVPGTALISSFPEGSKCVGWCNDNANNAVILLIYSNSGAHSVLRYMVSTGQMQNIFTGEPTLSLLDVPARAKVIDGRLQWVQEGAHPKSFDIEMAYRYTNGIASETGEAYKAADLPFDENIFPLIKRPPRYAPECAYEDTQEAGGVEINFNNLRGKLFQFKYNYEYTGNQESAYSPISKVPLPEGEVLASGAFTDNVSRNNTISVSVYTGSKDVRVIRVAVRDASNRNAGPFYVFQEIQKYTKEGKRLVADNVFMPVKFLNNTSLGSIDDMYGNAYFHDVPLEANDIMLLGGKYLGLSMPVKGYDKPDANYRLSISQETGDFGSGVITMPWSVGYNEENTCQAWYILYLPATIIYNSIYRVTLKNGNDIIHSVSVSIGDSYSGSYPEDVRAELFTKLRNDGFDGYLRYKGTNGLAVGFLWIPGCDYDVTSVLGSVSTQDVYAASYKSLKKGQYHPFCLIYNDGFGRYNIACVDRSHYELFASYDKEEPAAYLSQIYKPKWKVLNKPPEWATTFRWGYILNRSYTYMISVPGVTAQPDEEGGYTVFDINGAIVNYNTVFPKSILEPYIFQKGDRIKIIETGLDITDNAIVNEEFDDETEASLGFRVEHNFDAGQYHVEIYRPNRTPQSLIFQEIGEEHEILNPGTEERAHSGPVSSQEFIDGSVAGSVSALDASVSGGVQKLRIAKAAVAAHGVSGQDFLRSNYGTFEASTLIYSFRAGYSEVISLDDTYYQITLDDKLPTDFFFSDPTANYTITEIQVGAEGIMNFGDVYVRNRLFDGVSRRVVEDMNYCDFYVSESVDIGRAAVDANSERKELLRVVRGENYIEGTDYNKINIFLAESEYYAASELYGRITGIEEVGDVMKVIQEHKETSVYIGKNFIKDAQGGDILVDTDRTFGSPNRYDEFRGSKLRRSIASNGRYLYYFDGHTGEFIRSAPNGQAALSKLHGMQSYFDGKAAAIRASTNADVITAFNNSTEEVYVVFVIDGNAEVIVFREGAAGGFFYFIDLTNGSLIPHNFAWYGNLLYSFAPDMHQHGVGPVNQFYGSAKKPASVRFVANSYANQDNVFENIRIKSTGNWNIIFSCPPNDNYPHGQKSVLYPQVIDKQEGALLAPILRNIISRNGLENIQLLYSSNKMAANTLEVSMSNSDINYVNEVIIRSNRQT